MPKGKAKRKSPIWRGVGVEIMNIESAERKWQCVICRRRGDHRQLSTGQSTSGPYRHLRKHLKLVLKEDGKRLVRQETAQATRPSPLVQSFQRAAQQSPVWTQEAVGEFYALVIERLVCTHTAIHHTENRFSRRLISWLSPLIMTFVPGSSTTFKDMLVLQYNRQKKVQKTILQESLRRHTISFDVWTSPFMKKQIFGVIAHYVNPEYQRCAMLLSLRRLWCGHSGENVAEPMVDILEDWGISTRLGYFMADNEPANHEAIRCTLRHVKPDLSTDQMNQRRVRCLAHVLHLTAKAFVLSNPAKFETQSEVFERQGDLENLQYLWEQRGVIGKVVNFIRYIRTSPKERIAFSRIKVDDSGANIECLTAQDIEEEDQVEVCEF